MERSVTGGVGCKTRVVDRSEAVNALMPTLERLLAEGYVFPFGGGLYVRDDGTVLVQVRQTDAHLESILTKGCPELTFEFEVTAGARHVVLPPGRDIGPI